jgi:hypothetical protein
MEGVMLVHRSWIVAGFVLIIGASLLAVHFNVLSLRSEQGSGRSVQTPGSSIEHPGDVGARGHTNVEIFSPGGLYAPQPPPREFYEKKVQPSPPENDRSNDDFKGKSLR